MTNAIDRADIQPTDLDQAIWAEELSWLAEESAASKRRRKLFKRLGQLGHLLQR